MLCRFCGLCSLRNRKINGGREGRIASKTILSPIVGTPVQERFAVQHFIDALSDKDDRLYLGWEKPSTLDDALPFPRKRTRIPQTVG